MRRAEARLQRVDDDQQFHQIVVGGKARRLDDEHVLAADIFLDLDEHFHVGEAADLGLDEGQLEILADRLGQCAVGIAREQLHALRPVCFTHETRTPETLPNPAPSPRMSPADYLTVR